MLRQRQHRGIGKASSFSNDNNPDTDPALHFTESLTADLTPLPQSPEVSDAADASCLIICAHSMSAKIALRTGLLYPESKPIRSGRAVAAFSRVRIARAPAWDPAEGSSRPMGVPRAFCGPSRTCSLAQAAGWMEVFARRWP